MAWWLWTVKQNSVVKVLHPCVHAAYGMANNIKFLSYWWADLRKVDDCALPVVPRAEGGVILLADLGIPVEDVLAAPQEVAGLPWVHGLSVERERGPLTSFKLLLRRQSHLQLQFWPFDTNVALRAKFIYKTYVLWPKTKDMWLGMFLAKSNQVVLWELESWCRSMVRVPFAYICSYLMSCVSFLINLDVN